MTRPERPESVCSHCWRTWHREQAPPAIGFCGHHAVAWQIEPCGQVRTASATRLEYLRVTRGTEPRA